MSSRLLVVMGFPLLEKGDQGGFDFPMETFLRISRVSLRRLGGSVGPGNLPWPLFSKEGLWRARGAFPLVY